MADRPPWDFQAPDGLASSCVAQGSDPKSRHLSRIPSQSESQLTSSVMGPMALLDQRINLGSHVNSCNVREQTSTRCYKPNLHPKKSRGLLLPIVWWDSSFAFPGSKDPILHLSGDEKCSPMLTFLSSRARSGLKTILHQLLALGFCRPRAWVQIAEDGKCSSHLSPPEPPPPQLA